MKRTQGLIIAAVVVVAAVIGGTALYIGVIKDDPAPRLSLDDTSSTDDSPGSDSPDETASIDGTWTSTSESEVGYRVPEILFGAETEGIGRTNELTGSITIAGSTIEEADFEVQMATLTSDSDRRDGQVRDRILQTDQFPTSKFTLTEPIDLGAIPAPDEEVSAQANGELTLKGTTQPVTLDVTAKRSADTISILATYTIVFEEWGIDNPSFGPAQTGDDGLLEIKLVLTQES